MMEEQEGMQKQLPEDILSNIFRHLSPHCLATCRCVYKPWHTIIDTRRFLRSDLLPLTVAGIFINFHDLVLSEFFSRHSTGPTISDYLPFRDNFRNHCNGLFLLHGHVVNPVIRQWVQLPPRPSLHLGAKDFLHMEFLVFDPTLSPHYEVFLIPHVRRVFGWFNSDIKLNPAIEELEWPLSPCILHVFSSRTKGWEERPFIREGEAAGTVADMRLDGSYGYHSHNSVFWRGALYVHCQTNCVMRISLLDGKYQVIKPPAVEIELAPNPKLYLGRSQKGVYCALDDCYVYIMDESCGKMDWVLKTYINLRHRQTDRPKPWTIQDVNYGGSCDEYRDGNDEVIMERKFERGFDNSNITEPKDWDSDDDNVTDTNGWSNSKSGGDITFLGFHPYEEVVFLSEGLRRGLAYHLNSSKVQDLGNLSPTNYGFMYTERFTHLGWESFQTKINLEVHHDDYDIMFYKTLLFRTRCEQGPTMESTGLCRTYCLLWHGNSEGWKLLANEEPQHKHYIHLPHAKSSKLRDSLKWQRRGKGLLPSL